jgi:hypothetical protein
MFDENLKPDDVIWKFRVTAKVSDAIIEQLMILGDHLAVIQLPLSLAGQHVRLQTPRKDKTPPKKKGK